MEPAPAPPLDGAPQTDAPPPADVPQPIQQPLGPPAAPTMFQTAATSPQSVAPSMIGDLFNAGNSGMGLSFGLYDDVIVPGSVVGRQKISENSSPLPRNRVYVSYSYFDNTPLARGGIDVHRFTPGIEKTFLDGDMSFEVRLPFASTLDSTTRVSSRTSEESAELGDLTMYLKALLYDTPDFALAAGLGLSLPTSDDRQVQDGGVIVAEIESEAVHLLPYLGALYTPGSRFFAQGFVQLDFDTNGNGVSDGGPAGTLQDPTLIYLDLGAGYWIYRNFGRSGLISGIAPIFELHYNASVSGNDQVVGSNFEFGTGDNLDVVNLVFGLTTALHNNAELTFGYTMPFEGSDQQFDGELRVFYNHFFGGSTASGYNVNRRYGSY